MTLAISGASARLFWTVTCSPRLTSSGFSPRDIGVLTEPIQAKHLLAELHVTLIQYMSI